MRVSAWVHLSQGQPGEVSGRGGDLPMHFSQGQPGGMGVLTLRQCLQCIGEPGEPEARAEHSLLALLRPDGLKGSACRATGGPC